MKLNNVPKCLILIVPIMIIVACSFHKNVNNGNEFTMDTDAKIDNTSDFSGEKIRLKLQELQSNNVVYFDLDKYNIRSEFTQMLDKQVNFLLSNLSYKVTIEGYTDEQGTPEYNIALGERRANALKMYLQGKGVSADRITIISYGKEKPALLGHNESAYSKNRRAILVY